MINIYTLSKIRVSNISTLDDLNKITNVLIADNIITFSIKQYNSSEISTKTIKVEDNDITVNSYKFNYEVTFDTTSLDIITKIKELGI